LIDTDFKFHVNLISIIDEDRLFYLILLIIKLFKKNINKFFFANMTNL